MRIIERPFKLSQRVHYNGIRGTVTELIYGPFAVVDAIKVRLDIGANVKGTRFQFQPVYMHRLSR